MSSSPTQKRKKKKRTPLKNNLFLKKVLSGVCAPIVQLARVSWQVMEIKMHPDARSLIETGQPVIYALWHGRMYCLLKGVPPERTAILVSPSNDGEFITRMAQDLGFPHFIRGSHKRDGIQAVLGMHKALHEEGLSIAFTVDGPRGPRYKVKPGIVRLASQAKVPIIPIGSSAAWLLRKSERSWDHFHAPFFGSPMQLHYGQPIYTPANADEDTIQTTCKTLEESLMQINLESDAVFGFRNQEHL